MSARSTITPEEALEIAELQAEFIDATVHAGASMRSAGGKPFEGDTLQRVIFEDARATGALRRIREILGV
jgi:hypothetical protein